MVHQDPTLTYPIDIMMNMSVCGLGLQIKFIQDFLPCT